MLLTVDHFSHLDNDWMLDYLSSLSYLYLPALCFYRLWALCPCNSKKKITHKLPILSQVLIIRSPKRWASVTTIYSHPASSGPWSQGIGIDWIHSPGFPISCARECCNAEACASISPEIIRNYFKSTMIRLLNPEEMDMWSLIKHMWTSWMQPYSHDRKPGGRPWGLFSHWMVSCWLPCRAQFLGL
jgi:hypothetical protein